MTKTKVMNSHMTYARRFESGK